MMKKLCLRIAVALVSFAGLGITAKAQVVDQIVVTIPFEFVVAGKALPGGTYRVSSVSDDRWGGLILKGVKNHASAIVLPNEVENAPVEKAHVNFEIAGNEHFLSKSETTGNVFTIPVSGAEILWPQENHTATLLQEVL
jgi:hypothetical protein